MQLITRQLGLADYQKTLAEMQSFTSKRTQETPDELWLTEHEKIYTLGLNHSGVNIPDRQNIPIVQSDRGGKITYHGPGQVIIYLLIDLNRRNLKVRQLVNIIENSMIDLLAKYGVHASSKNDAPGVYVEGKKIGSVGLRLKNNCCYHGLSLNVDMDLSPFESIDPCGYKDMEMTQTKDLNIANTPQEIGEMLMTILQNNFEI
jgi:lipoyl(octanoyl) transferase